MAWQRVVARGAGRWTRNRQQLPDLRAGVSSKSLGGRDLDGSGVDEMIRLDPAMARAARAYTGLSHVWLGKVAGVASRTVHKLEKDGKVTDQSLNSILEVFGRFGVEMLYDDRGIVTAMTFRPRRGK